MKKRIFALVMSILLVVVSSAGAFAANTTPGDHSISTRLLTQDNKGANKLVYDSYEFEEVGSSDNYTLYLEKKFYIACLKDNATGACWYTSPPVAPKSLPKAIGAEALSMIVVNFTRPGVSGYSQALTYTGLQEDTCVATVSNVANGVRIDYEFTNYGIYVPVQLTVDNDGLVAEILFSEIKDSEECVVVSIDFLKYFGAAPEGTKEGYMIVPDGSGAIIDFDNGKDQKELQYSKEIYGMDMAEVTEQTTVSSREEDITLPVFGMVHSLIDYQDGSLSDAMDYEVIEPTLVTGGTVEKPNFNIVEAEIAVSEAESAVADAQEDVADKAAALTKKKETLTEKQTALTEAKTALTTAEAAAAAAPADETVQKDLEKAQKAVTSAEEAVTKAEEAINGTFDETGKLTKNGAVQDCEEADKALVEAEAALAAAKDNLAAVEAAEAKAAAEAEAQAAADAENPVAPQMYGFLAEVTSGAEVATLKASVSGMKGTKDYRNYNTIYTTAVYRTTYAVPLKGQVGDATSVVYNAQNPASIKNYTVRYRFMTENASYATLAAMYREVLITRGWLTVDGNVTDRFYVEFYGAVNKKKSFAGLIYNARETLTSFNEATAILEELSAAGVSSMHVVYSNFSDDYFNRDIELNLKPSGSLGGAEDLKALIEKAKSMNIDVALSADFISLPSGGNGFSTFFDVADVINISPIKVFSFSMNSNTRDTSKKPYYLLKAEMYGKAVEKLQASASKNGYTSLYFDEEAVQLYSDLAPNGYQSDRVSGEQAKQYQTLSDANLTLTLSNPNAYLFKNADFITDVPVCSSKEIVFDSDIPFLQMVLRGAKNFGGESMNITDVSQEYFLRHLEFGTDMKYSLINATSESLLMTDHTFLYSATYSNFKKQIAERYAAFKKLGAATNADNATIVAHDNTLADGTVSVTEYSNGTKVYVNYGSEDFAVDGQTVGAMNYLIV